MSSTCQDKDNNHLIKAPYRCQASHHGEGKTVAPTGLIKCNMRLKELDQNFSCQHPLTASAGLSSATKSLLCNIYT